MIAKPFFSVVIPAFNRASVIGATIRSILSQTYDDYEVIVVDDGSTDDTVDVVKQFSQVRLLKQMNCGPGAARNLGAKAAKGEFLAFLDSDDLWLPWTLQNIHRAVQSEKAMFVSGAGLEFRGEPPAVDSTSPAENVNFKDYFEAGAAGVWLGTCGVAVNRQLFHAAGGFAKSNINAEDSDLWLRLGIVSPFVQISSPPAFLYRRSDSSVTADISRSVAGAFKLLESEKNGLYPGGKERKHERQIILGGHLRPVCVSCFQNGMEMTAARIYLQSFFLNLYTCRFRFLFGAPILGIAKFIQRRIT